MQKSHDAYEALRFRDFRLYLLMRLGQVLSVQIHSVCIGIWIADLTGDPLMLGLVGLFEAVPAIAVSLYAGHLADKFSRKKIVQLCLANFFVGMAALFGLACFQNQIEKGVLVAAIFAVAAQLGFGRGFYSPAAFSFLGQLVPPESRSNAITWNSNVWEISSITGLALGGLLYGFLGVKWAFLIVLGLSSMAFLTFSMIPPRPIPEQTGDEKAVARIKEGLRFVWQNKVLLQAIALDMFAVLFGGAVAIIPFFAKEVLHVGPQAVGILRAAPAVGAIITATFLAHNPLKGSAGRWLFWVVAGFGLATIGFANSTVFWTAMFFLILTGVFDEVSVFIRMSLFQVIPPERMKGRVSSVNSIFITSSNEIGAFESGLAARAMGTVPSVIFGGAMTVLIVAGFAFFAPQLRNLTFEDLKKTAD